MEDIKLIYIRKFAASLVAFMTIGEQMRNEIKLYM